MTLIILVASSTWSTFVFGREAPADESSGFIPVESAQLFYRVVGTGTPLLILHGGPGLSHDYLAPQLIELLEQDYQLIFFDQRGSGRSTGGDDESRLTMAQFVSDIEQVRSFFPHEQVNLLGHSFGGLLGMYYAFSHPQRVSRLILLDSDAASWELRTPYQIEVITARKTESDSKAMQAIESQAGWSEDPRLFEQHIRISLRTYFADAALADELALRFDQHSLANLAITSKAVRADLGRYDIHDRLKKISAPTLIIHGDASVFSVEGAKALHREIPRSQLVILDDVGHFAYIESPRAFKAAIKAFLW